MRKEMNESIFGLQIHVVLTVMIFQWKKIFMSVNIMFSISIFATYDTDCLFIYVN